MTATRRLKRDDLGALQRIGQGAQARVYLAADLVIAGEDGPFAFKEYKKKNISIHGLDRIIAFRGRLTDKDRADLDLLCNWPLRVVEGPTGNTDGVILPLIPDPFFHEIRLPSGDRKRRASDGQYLAQPKERCDLVDLPFASLGDRYRFCRDLALAVGFLHKHEVCLGDISLGNLVYSLAQHPCVYLVDCDAYRLRGQGSVVPQLHTPDWVPPEGSHVQSSRTDEYKLGLFILRALVPERLSAQNRDPARADRVLDSHGRALLRRALAHDPKEVRTAPREWYDYFNGALRRRRFRDLTPHSSRRKVPTS